MRWEIDLAEMLPASPPEDAAESAASLEGAAQSSEESAPDSSSDSDGSSSSGGGGSDSNEATAGSSSDQIASIEEVKATANASDDSDNDNMESNEEDSSSRPKWWLHMQRAQPSKLRLAAPAGRCAGYQWMVRQLWQHQRIPRKRSRRSHKQPLLLASVLMAPTPVPLKKHQRSTWR